MVTREGKHSKINLIIILVILAIPNKVKQKSSKFKALFSGVTITDKRKTLCV